MSFYLITGELLFAPVRADCLARVVIAHDVTFSHCTTFERIRCFASGRTTGLSAIASTMSCEVVPQVLACFFGDLFQLFHDLRVRQAHVVPFPRITAEII